MTVCLLPRLLTFVDLARHKLQKVCLKNRKKAVPGANEGAIYTHWSVGTSPSS